MAADHRAVGHAKPAVVGHAFYGSASEAQLHWDCADASLACCGHNLVLYVAYVGKLGDLQTVGVQQIGILGR